jgi:MOSC domain-containing protein YiiM/alkylated DNA nucleotide flippase Atl1
VTVSALLSLYTKQLNNQKSSGARGKGTGISVASVFRRPQSDVLPEESKEILLRVGLGIEGDCHASPISPRQVLLTMTGTYEQFNLDPNSLRENILIHADEMTLSSGTLLRIGPDAALRITFECEPCSRLNRIRHRLSRDIKGKRGYLARVVRSGVVRPGDKIKVIKNVFRPLPDNWRDRVISIVRMLPSDYIISYARLANLAGVPKSFCRSFPSLLRSHKDIPWQRVKPSNQLISGEKDPCSVDIMQSNSEQNWLGSAIFADEFQFISEGELFSKRTS